MKTMIKVRVYKDSIEYIEKWADFDEVLNHHLSKDSSSDGQLFEDFITYIPEKAIELNQLRHLKGFQKRINLLV